MYNNKLTKIDYINAICEIKPDYKNKICHLHYLSLEQLEKLLKKVQRNDNSHDIFRS